MSILEPEEMRYAAISAFGLIIMTTLLKWSGLGQTRYTPLKPGISNTTQFNQSSTLDSLMEPNLTGGLGSGPLGLILDVVLTPFQIIIDFLLMWSMVWDSMGFMSIFIIVPMFLMAVIVAGAIVKLVAAIIPG